MVVSYWIPGSPQTWAASAMRRKIVAGRDRVHRRPADDGVSRPLGVASTARMNSSVTRTEWLAFWKKTLP